MITHERLKELIEQGATIWDNVGCQIKLINDSKHKISLFSNVLYVAEQFENCTHTSAWWEDYTIGFNDLYENEEDANWHKEFGCIERTERLELPTWEEFIKKGYFIFLGASGEEFGMEIIGTFDFGGNDYDDHIGISKTKDFDHNMLFKKIATKENYFEACRKCKELFFRREK